MRETCDSAEALPVGEIVPGDCLKTMAAWPADSVDLIFADPPYNIGYQYDKYNDRRTDDEYVAWTQQWIDACVRLLKPSGSFYLLIGDEFAAEARVHLKHLQRQDKLCFRNWIVWHYTFGQRCKIKFNRSHAHLFYCVGSAAVKSGSPHVKANDPPFTFNRDAIAVASARQTTYRDVRANPKGKLPDDTWYLRPQEAAEDGQHFNGEDDTWYVSRLCGTFNERVGWHPCQLPEALLHRIIKLSSNEGDIVFDPFVGSGTTLAVAAQLKRQYLGCELSRKYANKAQKRVDYCAKTGKTYFDTSRMKNDDVPKRPRRKSKPSARSSS